MLSWLPFCPRSRGEQPQRCSFSGLLLKKWTCCPLALGIFPAWQSHNLQVPFFLTSCNGWCLFSTPHNPALPGQEWLWGTVWVALACDHVCGAYVITGDRRPCAKGHHSLGLGPRSYKKGKEELSPGGRTSIPFSPFSTVNVIDRLFQVPTTFAFPKR